jgi:asparagine synthase (glutamine-hydrolysing)
MCGICGIIGHTLSKSDRDETVQMMNDSIMHRGPDEDGFFSDNDCSLAMRRLSIIDLNTGKQPIYGNLKTALIFFNGEIYNYKELKIILLEKDVVFNTTSDTEIIINLYEHFGTLMLTMLKGMFAFCIYDIEKKEYFFARDRFGEKPFYYYQNGSDFFFSSEIRSLLVSDKVPRKLNRSLLGVYLSRNYVPEPYTLFQDILSLPPGNFLLFQNGQTTVSPYFEVEYKKNNAIKTMEDATDYIEPFLKNAVKRQMISDVPIGAFLSGGIDSSTVVALMQQFSDKPIKTFNVKFQTKGYDESKIAKRVAEKVGTEHYEIVVENNTFSREQFWKILRQVGVPFSDSSAIPTDIVTNVISKHVKVALSGDGGDELFAGYEMFDWTSSLHQLKNVPLLLRRSGVLAIRSINNIGLGNNATRRISKALQISELNTINLLQETHAMFDKKELSHIYTGNVEFIDQLPAEWNRWSTLRKAMYYRIKYDLPLDMLIKVDRMSMSNSLEVRTPFLDPDLFEASATLPDRFLRTKGIGKLVIRKLMENDIPAEVFDHPKAGFSIPLHDFKNKEFRGLAEELLNEPYMHELFNMEAVNAIMKSGLNDTKDSATGTIYRKTHQLWSLMMLSGWIQMYNVEI